MKLTSPRNHFAHDVLLEGDAPVFATAGAEIEHPGSGIKGVQLTEMMANRWRVFNFFYQIRQDEEVDVPSCKSCFAKLVALGDPSKPMSLSQF